MTKNNKVNILLIFLGVCQVLDAILTYHGVSLKGLEAEGNPVVRWFMQSLGPALGLITVKSFAISVLSLLYLVKPQLKPSLFYPLIVIALLYFSIVILWIHILFI